MLTPSCLRMCFPDSLTKEGLISALKDMKRCIKVMYDVNK